MRYAKLSKPAPMITYCVTPRPTAAASASSVYRVRVITSAYAALERIAWLSTVAGFAAALL